MQPYRPLGTLYAAAALREAGLTVALFDTMLRDPGVAFAECMEEHKPRVVAIYEDDFNFLTKMCLSRMREVMKSIAQAAKLREVPVIVHGSDASDHPGFFLNSGADYLLLGEAENTLVALCAALLSGGSLHGIAGLLQRDATGDIIRSEDATSRNPNWERLPMPPLDLTDFAPYRQAWESHHRFFSVNMVASRGCPFRCNWCAKPISGKKFHLRPAADVAEEMRQLKVNVGAQHIWFSDDVFALNQQWVKELAHEVTARHASVPFKIQTRADLMTDQTVAALKIAGCTEIWMGVESGSQKVLDAMDKGLQVREVEEARRRLKHAGIRACFFLQFGYPGEQWKQLQETIALVRTTRPDDIGISFSYPLPGTPFYERVQSQLGFKRNWTESDDLCILFEAEYETAFYRAVRDALHAEVSSWTEADASLTQLEVDRLWARVYEMEPVSRTKGAEHGSKTDFLSQNRVAGFIAADELLAKAGAQ
jgi:radical SAM superfamily enzyme YgiQ (UPF0313 family)